MRNFADSLDELDLQVVPQAERHRLSAQPLPLRGIRHPWRVSLSGDEPGITMAFRSASAAGH